MDVDYCVLASGERNFPYHFHATALEIYFALKGHTLVRTEAGVEDFKGSANTGCRPGDTHQIINDSGEERLGSFAMPNSKSLSTGVSTPETHCRVMDILQQVLSLQITSEAYLQR